MKKLTKTAIEQLIDTTEKNKRLKNKYTFLVLNKLDNCFYVTEATTNTIPKDTVLIVSPETVIKLNEKRKSVKGYTKKSMIDDIYTTVNTEGRMI